MRPSTLVAAALCCGVAALGCRRRDSPEAAKARASARFLQEQIRSLEALVVKAEADGLGTEQQVAIGVSEEVVKALLDASLPREIVIAEHARLRIESAQALFRGNRGALLLRARIASAVVPDAYATVELGGMLKDFEFANGKLAARVALAHFSVIEASVGDLAADLIENLVKQHLDAIEAAIPPLVVPVSLEESVKIDGLNEGVVVAKPGALPLSIKVAQVIPTTGRLWILLDAKAGPWKALPAAEAR